MEQLVGLYIELIKHIRADDPTTGLSVNEICRRTSSKDKPRVLRSIGNLEDARIIETHKSSDHKQKKLKILTPLGHELAKLVESVDDYTDCYKKFEDKVKVNYDISDNIDRNILTYKLRDKGWSHEDILSYRQYRGDVIYFESWALFSFINCLLSKYGIILSKFVPSDPARIILTNFIILWLNKFLSSKSLQLGKDFSEGEKIRQDLLVHLAEQVYILPRIYRSTFEDEFDSHGRFVKSEASDLVRSLMDLLAPDSKIITPNFVEDLEDFVDRHELKKVRHTDIIKESTDQAIGTLTNKLKQESEGLGADTEIDVTLKGRTADHDVDLIVKSSGKIYLIQFKYLTPHVRAESMREWIFDAVDIIRDKNEKIIFVYLGSPSEAYIRALSQYYDVVLHFDKFIEYLTNEIGDTRYLKDLYKYLHKV